MFRTLSTLTLATALLSAPAWADGVVHYREGQRLNPVDVASILGGTPPAHIKTRSIRLLDDAPPAPAEPPAQALSLQVRFNFDSAEIAPAARPQLDALADGIKMLPPGRSVLVEGHTDTIGSDEYNRTLSLRRAHAVKRYLAGEHGIDPARLQTVGFGEDRTIAGVDPTAPENRRVQFRGL